MAERRMVAEDALVDENGVEAKGSKSQEVGNLTDESKEDYGPWLLVRHRKAGPKNKGSRAPNFKIGLGKGSSPDLDGKPRYSLTQTHSPKSDSSMAGGANGEKVGKGDMTLLLWPQKREKKLPLI